MALFNYLKPVVEAKGQGRARKLSLENEFLATLMHLRLGLLNQDIADRFSLQHPLWPVLLEPGNSTCDFSLNEILPDAAPDSIWHCWPVGMGVC